MSVCPSCGRPLEAADDDRPVPGPAPVARAAAEAWLLVQLAGGAQRVAVIHDRAAGARIALRTLRRARASLGIRTYLGGDRRWYMALPPEPESEA